MHATSLQTGRSRCLSPRAVLVAGTVRQMTPRRISQCNLRIAIELPHSILQSMPKLYLRATVNLHHLNASRQLGTCQLIISMMTFACTGTPSGGHIEAQASPNRITSYSRKSMYSNCTVRKSDSHLCSSLHFSVLAGTVEDC